MQINLPDIASRVEHGFHVTNDEARWLLSQIGVTVPRRKRCAAWYGEGSTIDRSKFVWKPTRCDKCNGRGYFDLDDEEVEVVK